MRGRLEDGWNLARDRQNDECQEQQRRDQEDHREAICVEFQASVGRDGNFGLHLGVGKTDEEIHKIYENIVDEVGEREDEGIPGCQKNVAEEVAKLVEDLEVHLECRDFFLGFRIADLWEMNGW